MYVRSMRKDFLCGRLKLEKSYYLFLLKLWKTNLSSCLPVYDFERKKRAIKHLRNALLLSIAFVHCALQLIQIARKGRAFDMKSR